MDQKCKNAYVNEVLKNPEKLHLRESDMNMFILDRHKIKVNCCKNAYSHLFCLVLLDFPTWNVLCEGRHTGVVINFCSKSVDQCIGNEHC